MGFEEPHRRLMFYRVVGGNGISPNFPYFCICGSSGWASVMIRPWKVVNDLKIGNWSVFVLFGLRFVLEIS